jgi:FixJ family two-component response regulator
LAQVPVISIIDDDESVRVATRRLVRSFGYVCHVFPSADEFLRSPVMDDTACLIADVQMPGMSGIELQSLLIARGNHTPMIFITAFPEEGIRLRALEGGAVGFLTKPFDGPSLVNCLDLALQRHAMRP